MCMKKQIKYRPKGLSKEEQKYVDSLVIREIVMTVILMVIGAIIVAVIFALTKQAAGL